MRISTSTGICCNVLWNRKMFYSCEESIEAIAEAGFDAIDLCFAAYGREGLPMAQPDWRDWVKRQKENCDKAGLPVTQAHAHYYGSAQSREFTSLAWEDNTNRIIRDIEAAGICKVSWLVIHPDCAYDEAGYSRRLSLKKEAERFKRFGSLAAKYGTAIAIENMVDNLGVKTGRRFGSTAEDLLDLLELLGDDKLFGICWDTGHGNIAQINQPAAIRQIGKHLKALHINDNKGEKDDHMLPYLGTVDWEPLLAALKEVGYSGDFTYEIHNFSSGFTPKLHHDSMKFACRVARQMVSCME